MIEQQVMLRVEELAARAGYPMPSVRQVPCKEGENCISMGLNDAAAATLKLHEGLEDRYPERVRDFLIIQEFVQARLGVHRRHRWIAGIRTGFTIVVGFVAVLTAIEYLEPVWVAFPVVTIGAYLVSTLFNLVLAATVSRWAMRRADRALVEVLGREQVVDVLQWFTTAWPSRLNLRWVWFGAPPTARERLRWRGVSG